MLKRMKKLLALAGLTASLFLPAGITAFAADLGGNCCADLEERVAELEATSAKKGNKKVSVTVYGTVNYGVMWSTLDTGPLNKTAIVSPAHDPSRFGFAGQGKINTETQAGFVFEFEVKSNFVSGALNVLGDPWVQTRKASVWIESKTLGRLTLGKDSQATDGLSEITVANTRVAAPMLRVSPLEYYTIVDPVGISGTRTELVRYDTAAIAGFTGSASWASDKTWDAALRFAKEVGGFQIAAGVGMREQGDGLNLLSLTAPDTRFYLGSASIKHMGSGLFANGAYSTFKGTTLLQGTDQQAWAIQAGIEKNFFGPGATTAFGEFQQIDRQSTDAIKFWGLGLVQSFDAASIDLYANWRSYEANSLSASRDDVFMSGMRIKF